MPIERKTDAAAIVWPTSVLHRIQAERNRQDIKWGPQNHGDIRWLAILFEEALEVGCEIQACEWDDHTTEPETLKKELIQVAAVAVAWIEAIERRPS